MWEQKGGWMVHQENKEVLEVLLPQGQWWMVMESDQEIYLAQRCPLSSLWPGHKRELLSGSSKEGVTM